MSYLLIIAAMSYAPPQRLLAAAQAVGIPQACYLPGFLDRQRADELLAHALAGLDWRHERLTMFGREVTAPRLVAWYGEAGTAYRYSGVVRRATPWHGEIRALALEVGAALQLRFNYVLANRYRDGNDMLGWHADDERDLGDEPVIAAVSVGAARVLRLRARRGGASKPCTLAHGSLLVMWGRSQRDYKHCLPRTAKPVGERISFTFRYTASS